MTTETGSTVPRRQLGRYLRTLREDAHLTVKAAAEALEWSTPKMWRIETGATSMRSLDVEAMCRLYRASPQLTAALMGLARETRGQGWWHSYGDAIPEWFELYVGLEAAASRLRKYEAQLVPGLLQTRAYATRVYEFGRPGMAPEEIDGGVAVRLERQALLTRAVPRAPQVDIVLDEAALRRSIGPGMAEQLRHLNAVGELPNVSVRVLPFDAGLHRAEMANGAFTILEFPDVREPPVIYSDGLTGALYLDKPQEVAAYEQVWADIDDRCLDGPQARKLIAAMAEGSP